jgi:hypothetical protein
MKWLVLTCFLLSPLFGVSQDSVTNNILTTKKFRRGIYASFKELKENNPSIITEFKVEADSSKFDRYNLYSSTDKKIKKVYGFCDGEYLYLNAKTYGQGNYFVRILVLGKIIYFEDKRGKRKAVASQMNGPAIVGGAIGGAIAGALVYGSSGTNANENPGWVIYTEDENGEPFILDYVTLSSILQEADPELNRVFKGKKDNGKFLVLIDFMNQFNQRNK